MLQSEEGKIPEVDLSKLDHISALITTFEQKDLKTYSTISLFYDKINDYVFLELFASVNNQVAIDDVVGFDKEKMVNLCKNVIRYFENKV